MVTFSSRKSGASQNYPPGSGKAERINVDQNKDNKIVDFHCRIYIHEYFSFGSNKRTLSNSLENLGFVVSACANAMVPAKRANLI